MSYFKKKLNDLKNLPTPQDPSHPMSFFSGVVKQGAKIVEHGRNELIGEHQARCGMREKWLNVA